MSSLTHLSGRLGTHITVAPVEEVVVVPERETVSRVMTAPCRLGEVIAPLIIAKNGKVDTEHVAKLVKETPSRQVTERIAFPSITGTVFQVMTAPARLEEWWRLSCTNTTGAGDRLSSDDGSCKTGGTHVPVTGYVPNGQPLGDLGRDPVQLL